MPPLSPNEPSIILDQLELLVAKKIRFEINKLKLPMGVEGIYGVIKHPGASLAVPITDDGHVIILRQYRFAIERRILEFPAGTLEENEEPLSSMKRELAEESGFSANDWNPLGIMHPCPGYSDETIHLFLARGLKLKDGFPKKDLDEDIEVMKLTFDELDNFIENGNEALDGKSVTAWYRAKQFLSLN